MAIEFLCTTCGCKIQTDDGTGGAQIHCPHPDCGRLLNIPAFSQPESELKRQNARAIFAAVGKKATPDPDVPAIPAAHLISTPESPSASSRANRRSKTLSPEAILKRRSRHLFWTMEGVFLLALVTTIFVSDRSIFHNNLPAVIGRFFGLILFYTLVLIEQSLLLKVSCSFHNMMMERDEDHVRVPPMETAMLIGFMAAILLFVSWYIVRGLPMVMTIKLCIGISVWLLVWSLCYFLFLTGRDHKRAPAVTSMRVNFFAQVMNLLIAGLMSGAYVFGQQMEWW